MNHRRIMLFAVVIPLWAALLTVAGPSGIAAEAGSSRATHEYQVKAAFLYNFVKFTEWPAQAFKHPKDPIRVAIVGPDRFGDAFAPFQSKTIKGRRIEIVYTHDEHHACGCHVAFYASTDQEHYDYRFLKKPHPPVLTVGETPGFSSRGGMVNFVVVNNKIRFEINPDAAAQAGLKISSKLLHLATIVREKGQAP